MWAVGWPIDVRVSDEDLPAHAAWRECPMLDDQLYLYILGIGLLVLAATTLIARAITLGGWRQIGLWAGLLVMVDAVLMLQYVRYLMPLKQCGFD
jgi:hypothetical protein